MTSAWHMLTMPRAALRDDAERGESPGPDAEQPHPAGPGAPERSNGAAPAGRTADGGRDLYLEPALRAAAAARAHTARIRAGQSQPAPPTLAERLAQEATGLPADPGPQSCRPSTENPTATVVAAGPRGLSVAAAARASTIAFRPLRQTSAPLLQDADPASAPAVTAAPAHPMSSAIPAPPTASAAAAPPTATVAPASPMATVAPGPPVAESGPAPRPAESAPRRAPRRAEPQRRFAKTIAEVERYRAATQGDEPGAHVVPSPVLARPEQDDTAGGPWSRLWSRRKGPVNG